jgi:hypothetical protein
MNKSMGFIVASVLGLVACNVEHYDDECGDKFDYGDDVTSDSGHAGSKAGGGHGSTGGSSATQAGSGASAGTDTTTGGTAGAPPASDSGGDGGGDPPVVPATACEKERDCAPGNNCNYDVHECQPAAEETCGELDTELACTHRSDCTPIYGGTNCSCGQDCECHGGEPGCVCESFQFFVCQAAE